MGDSAKRFETRQLRSVVQRVVGHETSDGAGVNLRRVIGSPELNMLDPFLLLDQFRSDDPDDYIAGFPPHPHRGFETVTYLLHGNMRHKDSAGHEGLIRSGGVQWMTAGSGIEHSEMPEQIDGLMDGFQLWVNLPADQKMMTPRYQEIEPEAVPVEQHDDGTVIRVIAGTTLQGTEGAVHQIAAQPLYLDVSLPAGSHYEEQIPLGHNAFVYVMAGPLEVAGTELAAGSLAVLGEGDGVVLESTADSRFLLVAGKPFNEPVARHGPFVMNAEAEIQQAFADYRAGHFGTVEG
ncbi:quercetin 2,3-dioxygenase [Solemya pervernicosa gill symbiont]|uniref:Quercetin 2,3-dioxygenase n=2 Tax=Gammaproteobacteria incertae sedis TaxID=118884 RepID=A0A1T2L2G5_9GAMM|nr:pirin family protein [Candidatus Reidiella endopervernicosa]OOZ39283.1 quercetin 2,3-dioxygenase [Solemya pervernicosa gill symbiont]QKQ25539.1 pirin family protein [Candidatus Reidiella endopervernicosa]